MSASLLDALTQRARDARLVHQPFFAAEASIASLSADALRMVCGMASTPALRTLCSVSHLWSAHATGQLAQRLPAPGEYTTMHTHRSWELGQERLNALQTLGHPVWETMKAQTRYVLTIHDDKARRFNLKRHLFLDGVYHSGLHDFERDGFLPIGGGVLRFREDRATETIELMPEDEEEEADAAAAARRGMTQAVKHLRVSEFAGRVGHYSTWRLRAPVVIADFESDRQQRVATMQLHGPHEKRYG